MQQLVQVCYVLGGQQQLLLLPLVPSQVQEGELLGADQALPLVGGGAGQRVHFACNEGGLVRSHGLCFGTIIPFYNSYCAGLGHILAH